MPQAAVFIVQLGRQHFVLPRGQVRRQHAVAAGIIVLGDERDGLRFAKVIGEIARPNGRTACARPAELCVRHFRCDGGGIFFPLVAVGGIGFEIKVWLVADGKAGELRLVVLRDIFGSRGSVGDAAIAQTQGVNHSHVRRPGKSEQAVNVRRAGNRNPRAVGGVSADAQGFDAKGLK